MVAQFEDQPVEDEDPVVSPSDEQVEPAEEEVETPEPEQDDPLATLSQELESLRGNMATRADLERALRAAGRVEALQSELDRLKGANPLADLDPRISANESVLTAAVNALLSSDLLDDSAKSQIQQSLAALSEVQTKRQRDQIRNEILAEVRESQQQGNQQQQADPQDAINYVQVQLMGYAANKGVDWAALPESDLQFRPGETLEQAAIRVSRLIDSLAAEDTAAERVTNRRTAAGSGTPSRSGAATTAAELMTRLENNGIPMTDEASRKRAASALGVTLD